MDEIGDVVFFAVVPKGQEVEWTSGVGEPDHSLWVSGEAFTLIHRAFAGSRIPALSKLDVYSETRISSEQCRQIIAAWPSFEKQVTGTVAEKPAEGLPHLLNVCAATSGTELLFEGP